MGPVMKMGVGNPLHRLGTDPTWCSHPRSFHALANILRRQILQDGDPFSCSFTIACSLTSMLLSLWHAWGACWNYWPLRMPRRV